VAGPGDRQQEGGVVDGFDIVADGCPEREEIAGGEVVRLAANVHADLAVEDLHGDGAVGVVLLHVRAAFHGDEHNAEVVFLEERPSVLTGLPGLLRCGLSDLVVEIEVRHPVDHGAIGE
jgi:hypothetical protein